MTDMTKPNDGGPAFPFQATDVSNMHMQTSGMTLREWYAGQALVGELAGWRSSTEGREFDIARRCFAIADAMIDVSKA